jgi:hypothetical protein
MAWGGTDMDLVGARELFRGTDGRETERRSHVNVNNSATAISGCYLFGGPGGHIFISIRTEITSKTTKPTPT